MIKEYSVKLNVDRLGNIKPSNNISQKENNNLVLEPEAIYRKIQTFTSFEEAKEADAKAKVNISPEQHLANVTGKN